MHMPQQDQEWLLTEKYGGEKTADFLADCARLEAGEPLAYLIGYMPFLGTTIWLDSRPLIPRPETEYWLEKAIAAIKTFPVPRTTLGTSRGEASGCRVLDLCAGSGCIGVAVAVHVPESHITFGEVDSEHLPTIEKNCLLNEVDHFTIRTSDLFSQIDDRFDFILSNPPYIDPALDRTQASVKAFEPHQALYGGKGGGELIERIIKEAPDHLNPGGQLWIEHEPEQAALIAALGTASGFTVSTLPDQYGTLRYSVLVLQ